MTGREPVDPERPAGLASTAAYRREVQRRANQLCRGAEPHADEIPCSRHVQEAQRQLVGLVV